MTPKRTSAASNPEERRQSRTELAYAEISDRLGDLRFPPGFRFTDAEVAKELGMSKTPVREALLMHVAQGLVYPRPGAGYVVVPITVRDVRSLFRHWRRLADTAIEIVTNKGIDTSYALNFQEILGDFEPLDAHTTFYDLVFWLTDDRFMIREWGVLGIEIERLLRLVLTDKPDVLLAHLSVICQAFTAEDEADGRKAVRKHIDDLEQAVITALLSGDFLQEANLAAPKK